MAFSTVTYKEVIDIMYGLNIDNRVIKSEWKVGDPTPGLIEWNKSMYNMRLKIILVITLTTTLCLLTN